MSSQGVSLWYCGELFAPRGIADLHVRAGLDRLAVEVHRSGHDGTWYLRTRVGTAQSLDMDSGQGPGFLFQGNCDDLDWLNQLSESLSRAAVVHRIEIHRESPAGARIAYLHFEWLE